MKRVQPPDIDPRDAETVARQTAALAQRFSGWPSGDATDAGTALVGAFAAMAQQVIVRLNQMPDRHFLAYLRMLGLEPRPPQAAQVPLTFTPTAGTRGVLVPTGTQVRGQRADGTDATFYTSDALELMPASTQAVERAITYQPDADLVADNSARATGEQAGNYSLLTGHTPVMHAAYLSADGVLSAVDAEAGIRVSIACVSEAEARRWMALQDTIGSRLEPILVWEYASSAVGDWTPIGITERVVEGSDCRFVFDLPLDMAACSLPDAPEVAPAYWIRARLSEWPEAAIPAWRGATISAVDPVQTPAGPPRQVQFNGVPVDTGKDYYPLGWQPVFNDACTLVYGALPDATDAMVTIGVSLSEADEPLRTTDSPTVVWEVGRGDTWTRVQCQCVDADDGRDNPDVARLKASGTASFALPGPFDADPPVLRLRLIQGDYGKGVVVASSGTSGDDVGTATGVIDDGYRPPILSGLVARVSYTPSATALCMIDNGEGLRHEAFGVPSVPFQRRDDRQPAFYLAFGTSLGQGSVSIYLDVAPLSTQESTSSQRQAWQDDAAPAVVQWDYSAPSRADRGVRQWKPLDVADGTHGFLQSGFLRFIAPADHTPSAQFGSTPLYWLRARLASGGYALPPRAGRVLPNSVAATDAREVRDEVLGSSRQTPGQTFRLAHTPVLADPRLVVREPTAPDADELTRLQAVPGPSAMTWVHARAGEQSTATTERTASLGTAWVCWKQVGSFAASGPRDRHYTLDHQTGTVTFGDGRNGMVPPAGEDNIAMAGYRSGGGAGGNLEAGTLNRLATAVAQVASVDNHVAASGGADGESIDAVMDWGPRLLRHRGRATARQDYEDLVRQAFPQVAKVCAIAPRHDPTSGPDDVAGAGAVLVVVVPDVPMPCPTPTAGLLRQVGDHLRARMPPTVQLRLSGPDWLVVDVRARVIANVMDRAQALQENLERAVRGFLDPLSGGFDRSGWRLGQMVHDSDLIRRLNQLPGVDGVQSLDVVRTSVCDGKIDEVVADTALTALLVCAGSVQIRITGSA